MKQGNHGTAIEAVPQNGLFKSISQVTITINDPNLTYHILKVFPSLDIALE